MSVIDDRIAVIERVLGGQPDGCTVNEILDLIRADRGAYRRLFGTASPSETAQQACRLGWKRGRLERGPCGFQAGHAYWLPREVPS